VHQLFKLFSLVLAILLLACSQPGNGKRLLFEDGWVRAMPLGSMMTAGFGQLINQGDEPIEITGYSSPQFASVSLHRSVQEDGVTRMEEVPLLSLQAGSEVSLAPGGYHVMFMRPLEKNPARVVLHIEVSGEQRFSFELPVERR
jgi:copper(I)-binding protein